MQKAAKVVCALVVMLSIFHGICLNVVKSNDIDEVCPSCNNISAKILSRMNQKVDPCDDFYEFACGSFLNETIIPEDKFAVSALDFAVNQLNEQLRVILNEPIQSDEIKPFENAKKLFQSCMNTEVIEERGIAPVLSKMNEMGGWPVLMANESWNETEWTWEKSMVKARVNGFNFELFVDFAMFKSIDKTIKVMISKPDLGFSTEHLKNLSDPFIEAYHQKQIDMAVMFGAEKSHAEMEMREVLNFESELSKIFSTSPQMNATIEDFQTSYNYTDWLEYFNSILPREVQLNSSRIIHYQPDFFDKLDGLLKITQKRVLANYVMWRHAEASIEFMPKAFTKFQLKEPETKGKVIELPRWLVCVKSISSGPFSTVLSALYVRKHFNEDAKKLAVEMVDNIRSEFMEMLKENSWMDAKTKEKALEKAEKMTQVVGFKDESMIDSKIEEYYAFMQVDIDEGQFFETTLKLLNAMRDNTFKRSSSLVDGDEWTDFEPAVVNAYYYSVFNEMVIPAGVMQRNIFNAKRLKYMNYAAIGYVIGHEITHGFDDDGSEYDAEGSENNWWESETKDKFKSKVQCIADQYTNYVEPITQLNLNGTLTQGENIADLGGLKQVYRAYVKWAKENPKEPKLSGLEDFTTQQMFWISYAGTWCNVGREVFMKLYVDKNVHSPGRFRVNGPLSNLKEFSDDFKCVSGTKMNPVDKCEIW